MDPDERLWVAFGDAAAGHLKLLRKQVYACNDWRDFDEDIQTINSLNIQKLVLIYNGFDAFETLMLANFLNEIWAQKKRLNFDLEFFILPGSCKEQKFADNSFSENEFEVATSTFFLHGT